jgi:hypothetical protein
MPNHTNDVQYKHHHCNSHGVNQKFLLYNRSPL